MNKRQPSSQSQHAEYEDPVRQAWTERYEQVVAQRKAAAAEYPAKLPLQVWTYSTCIPSQC